MTLKEEFVLLGVDVTDLDKKQGDLDELVKRQADTRAKMLGLRPSDKDYSRQTAEVVAMSNALEVQIQAARQEVEAEEARLKQFAIENVGAYVDPLWHEVQALDVQAVQALVSVYDTLVERDKASIELDRRAAILDGWNYELQARQGVHRPVTPWLADWMGWRKALREYTDRFVKLAESGKPAPGKELDWFSPKRV